MNLKKFGSPAFEKCKASEFGKLLKKTVVEHRVKLKRGQKMKYKILYPTS